MNPNVLIAAIAAAGSIVVAETALLLNYRAFSSIERRLEVIEGDLKEFFRQLARHETDISRLKDKTGLQ
jgi:hypothetical protein